MIINTTQKKQDTGVMDVKVGTTSVVSQGVATLGTAAEKDTGTSSGNIPVLNAQGKLDNTVLPPLAIGEYKGEVATKAALVTLSTAEKGDIAKVTSDSTANNNGIYWLNGTYSVLADWIQIVGPANVISVNGHTGVVTDLIEVAGTGLSKNGTTLNHSAVIASDTASTQSPGFNETFTAVDSVTRDSTGHVTKINVKTVTLPQYTAGSGLTKNGNEFKHSATIASDTTDTATPSAGGTISYVDSVTRDSTGHVTKINTKTATLPTDVTFAQKIGTTASHPAIGTATKPVYVNANGQVVEGTQLEDGAYLDTGAISNGATTLVTGGTVYTALQDKQDKNIVATNKTASSWTADSTYATYGYACTIAITGVTANDYAEVVFDPADAKSGNLAPVCDTVSGGVKIYAKTNASVTVPTVIIMKG